MPHASCLNREPVYTLSNCRRIPASKHARLVEVQLGMQQLLLRYLKTGSHHTRCAAQECLLRLEAAVKQPANTQGGWG